MKFLTVFCACYAGLSMLVYGLLALTQTVPRLKIEYATYGLGIACILLLILSIVVWCRYL